jgi:hypothetical protein
MKLWIIRVDYNHIPWEDFSQALRVVRGTRDQADEYINELSKENEDWLYFAEQISEEGITEL